VFDISPIQIILVLAVALLVFGPKRLPEMGRSIGRGIRDFRDGMSDESREDEPRGDDAHAGPSLEAIVKENVTPEPAEDDRAPLTGSRS
jgi:sec-independent protein translocase protein TatA